MDSHELLAHIWENSEPHDSGCMIWGRAEDTTGYGLIRFEGKLWTVHVLVLTLLVGDRPPGMIARRNVRCVSKKCVNPKHLRWEKRTRRDREGLDAENVAAIRKLHSRGLSMRECAEMFSVPAAHVRRIVRRQAWR